MIVRSTKRLLLTLICFAIVTTIGAVMRPTMAQCETVTDKQLVTTIYGKIKADKALASQISHINIVSVYAAVKFQGWANSKKDFTKIKGFAVNTACVKLVNVNNFAETPPVTGTNQREAGCAAGMKACGDICIPEADTCNITEFLGFLPAMFRFDRGPELELFGMAGCG